MLTPALAALPGRSHRQVHIAHLRARVDGETVADVVWEGRGCSISQASASMLADLVAEVGLDQKKHLAAAGIELSQSCSVVDEWPLDRDLVTDMLNNAIQNAGRYARSRVHIDARLDAGWLVFSVEDDGPGFATLPPACGTGLTVAHRLAFLHRRQERDGSLHLSNGASLGGARFELRLP